MARATRDAEGTVRAYVDVWNERDYSKIPEVVSESVSVYNPTAPGGEVHGRDGLEAFMRGVVAGFPDFHVAVHDVVSNDDLVMYDATLTMTHEGEFDGIHRPGERSKFRRWPNTTSRTTRSGSIASASTSRRSSNNSDSPTSENDSLIAPPSAFSTRI
jgi:predicted ester cyclase